MREIEIKARVADQQKLLAILKAKNIELSSPKTQRDLVFGEAGVVGDDHNKAAWLRIRQQTQDSATKTIFTLKKSISGQLDSLEHETEVADAAELEAIILQLGFEPYSDITKVRQTGHWGDIEICFDEVTSLGTFIELEKLTAEAEAVDHTAVVDELWGVLASFGITKDQAVTDGYDVLLRKSQGFQA